MQFEAREVGQRIAQARNEAGLTQEQLAELASFSKRSLQDYEAGVTIPYRHMREISRLLSKEVEWFLHGERAGGDRLEALEEKLTARLEDLTAAVEALTARVPQRAEGEQPPDARSK